MTAQDTLSHTIKMQMQRKSHSLLHELNRWKGTVGTTIWLWGHSRGLINILPPGRGDCTGWIIRSCSARTRKQA